MSDYSKKVCEEITNSIVEAIKANKQTRAESQKWCEENVRNVMEASDRSR